MTSSDLVDKLKLSSEATITTTGRKSKGKFSTPVWFALGKEEGVILVPMKGSDNGWFKNLEKDARIELRVGDTAVSSKARLVRGHNEVERVLDRFRAKYRSMWSESYYTKRDVYVEVPL